MGQSQRTRGVPDNSVPPRLDAKGFVIQYIKSQTAMMEGMVQMILRGEVVLDETGANEIIDRLMNEWMEAEDPTFRCQMKAMAAMFLDELLEAVFAARNGTQNDLDDDAPNVAPIPDAAPGYIDVTIEVLKTVRSIWGKK